MRGAIHLLIIAAVLWCGLHLSSAEADVVGSASFSMSVLAQADHDSSDDHSQQSAPHGCHSHCPLATDIASGPALGEPVPVKTALFALPSARLASIALAPPIEPPSA